MERQPRPQLAVAEEAIALYDTYWFRRLVLSNACPPPAPLPPPAPEREQPEQAPAEESKSELRRAPSGLQRHRRTRSDEAKAAAFHGQLEPLKIPNGHRARLQTILSGKDGLAAPEPLPLPERRRLEARRPGGRRRRSRRGRSLSELEFEEVKGLQDLGFTFSETEVDAELASIVPGLRRLRAEEEAKRAKAEAEEEACRRNRAAAEASHAAPRRPYLSEAWEDEEAEVRRMLSNFRIPAAADGADLKENLRLWAHTVASAVR
ncbi:hypothetical protein D1007_25073 [Hordeum vulgare]|uniref:Predicted protein n=1 Tax=Hordeum vulgare subsp. vulgare TaxID=112509 RepID=F2EIN2_HORVV|nr:uncharacterized protein LOC123408926 [Hordeum vulgare subsp. vulgare]KAE8799497.1 hypothetical protein D1007_25073 [Hordeum vulgare]KAI4971518.1 hypothetical protein ZWY2020_002432 [Hordeum vulgare]BAK07204.1 predicted protein [Hordeum vulgare subsp. vulgare]